MARAITVFLIVISSAFAGYRLLSPSFRHTNTVAPSPEPVKSAPPPIHPSEQAPPVVPGKSSSEIAALPSENQAEGTRDTQNPDSAPPVTVPLTRQQETNKRIEAERSPLYNYIRSHFTDLLVGWEPSPSDPATLDLYATRATPTELNRLLTALIQPYASKFGFNHVRIFTASESSESQAWALQAEATPDSDSNWHAFAK